MMVDALYQPVFMATNSYMPNYDFGEFVFDGWNNYGFQKKHLPDHWLFRCDLPDKKMIQTLGTFNNKDYPRRIGEIMGKQDLGPIEVLRLRDVAFCYEHGIDPLSDVGRHHNLIHNQDYLAEASRYGTGLHVICAGEAVFPT